MARIKALPALSVIKGLKGTLDYYLWKGLPCVRSWPKTPRHHLTTGTLAAAAIFGQVLKSYRLLADTVLEAFREDAADQTRTARDIFVSAVYGNLHEVNMGDFLDALQACRDSLLALEGLLGALGSVATDRLIVKGEDQLISFKGDYWEADEEPDAVAGDNYLQGSPVDAGEIWCITSVICWNTTTQCSTINIWRNRSGALIRFRRDVGPPITGALSWQGALYLREGDFVQALLKDCVLGDNIFLHIAGFKFTLET